MVGMTIIIIKIQIMLIKYRTLTKIKNINFKLEDQILLIH
jgi:hypothetical protein